MLVGLGLLAADWGNQGVAQAGHLTELRVGELPIADAGSLFAADARGFLQKRGLRVTIVFMTGGPTIAAAVASGALDLGMSNVVSILQARNLGSDVKCIAGASRKPVSGKPVLALMSSPRARIANAAGLRGKRIGINTLGNIAQLIVEAYVARHGVAPRSLRFVAIDFPQMPRALSTGRVDAAIVDEPFVTLSEQKGATILEPRPYEAIADFPLFACYFGSGAWITAHLRETRAFVDALNEANRYIGANPDYLPAILPRYTKISPSVAARAGLPEFTTSVSVSDLQPWLDAAIRFKLVKTRFDLREVIQTPLPSFF